MDNNAKLRPLYLAKILYERTDEDHYLTTMQLAQILEAEYGAPADHQDGHRAFAAVWNGHPGSKIYSEPIQSYQPSI